jgi:hypothetical protein
MYIYDKNPHEQAYIANGHAQGKLDALTMPTDALGRSVDAALQLASDGTKSERDRWYCTGYVQGVTITVVEQFNAVPSYVERFKEEVK